MTQKKLQKLKRVKTQREEWIEMEEKGEVVKECQQKAPRKSKKKPPQPPKRPSKKKLTPPKRPSKKKPTPPKRSSKKSAPRRSKRKVKGKN